MCKCLKPFGAPTYAKLMESTPGVRTTTNFFVLLTETERSLWENLKPRPYHFDGAIVRSIWQGRGLRFLWKDQMFKVNKVFIIQRFALLCRQVISHGHYRRNQSVQAHLSVHYISYKHKPYNKTKCIAWCLLFCVCSCLAGWLYPACNVEAVILQITLA